MVHQQGKQIFEGWLHAVHKGDSLLRESATSREKGLMASSVSRWKYPYDASLLALGNETTCFVHWVNPKTRQGKKIRIGDGQAVYPTHLQPLVFPTMKFGPPEWPLEDIYEVLPMCGWRAEKYSKSGGMQHCLRTQVPKSHITLRSMFETAQTTQCGLAFSQACDLCNNSLNSLSLEHRKTCCLCLKTWHRTCCSLLAKTFDKEIRHASSRSCPIPTLFKPSSGGKASEPDHGDAETEFWARDPLCALCSRWTCGE